jgi:DNA-binding transcriptional regulator GbsR (MarR family)
MSEEQLTELKLTVDKLTSIFALIRVVGGVFAAIFMAIASLAIWVNNTSVSMANTDSKIRNIESFNVSVVDWQRRKDDIDIKLVLLLENQQILLKRIEGRQDTIMAILPLKADKR